METKGSSCLIPLKGLKLSEGYPFHNTLKVDDSIQAIIRSTILLGNPISNIVSLVHLYSHQTFLILHLSHRMHYFMSNNYIIINMSHRDKTVLININYLRHQRLQSINQNLTHNFKGYIAQPNWTKLMHVFRGLYLRY